MEAIKVVSAGTTQISDFVYQLAKAFLLTGAKYWVSKGTTVRGYSPHFFDNNISLFHTQSLWHYKIIYFS